MTSPTVAVGGVAAGATTGALIAIGHRLGSVGLPFAAIGAIIQPRASTLGATTSVGIGLLVHVAVVFVWSAIFVSLMRRFARVFITALLVAIAQFVLSGMVARIASSGLASVLPLGDRLVYAVVLGAALVVGMRFAPPLLRSA